MPPDSEITEQILGAWDEDDEETTASVAEEEPEEEHDQEETPEEPDEELEEEEEEEPVDEEPEEEEPEPEEAEEPDAPAVQFETEDLEIRAFLAKYGGDPEKALKGAAELQRLITRQGSEKNAALERVTELETELERARAYQSDGLMLNDQQREWVDEAIGSGNPNVYVQNAIEAAEFDLARAVVREWAREDPYGALRAGQRVDSFEQQMIQPPTPQFSQGEILNALSESIPDMSQYWGQMTSVVTNLGEDHPLVRDSRSADLETSTTAIIGIYEIARASSTSVRAAREDVRARARQNGTNARQKAVVSSSAASPSATETPRTVRLGPGLTLEDLDAEFARE